MMLSFFCGRSHAYMPARPGPIHEKGRKRGREQKKRTAVHENTRFPGRHCPSAKDFLTGVMGCPKRESVVGGVLYGCGVSWCALRDMGVCRKARVVGVGWSACHPTALSLLSQPPVLSTMLSLLSQPPLFTFGHFRRFHSRLWRTPRTLSPCTSKYSCRVALQHLDSQCLTRISCLPRHAG